MMHIAYTDGGEPRRIRLEGAVLTVGRGTECGLVLADPSVSRLHCEVVPDEGGWAVVDLGSTNGVFLNDVAVKRARLAPGDRLKIGTFELGVEGEAPPPPGGPADDDPPELRDATVIRSVAELAPVLDQALDPRELRAKAYGDRLVGSLVRLAGFLIRADTLDQVIGRVMDAAFEALPVDRGFLFLDQGGELVCALARHGVTATRRPQGELPVSQTLLKAVIDRGLALVTTDAQTDERLAGGESLRIHQIRAALCAPLWSGERIVGVLQLDTPLRAGTFTEGDLELACALANYAAVAVERIRFAGQAEEERRLRSRLERYHSPAVVEEVLRGGPAEADERRLRAVEATVLFADLVGFTSFSETAGPEEVAELLRGYFECAVEEVFAAGGTLDKFIGDCVMAFFGAPVPQADHALRAVRAGLAIQTAVAAWNRQRRELGRPALSVRVAVNSGPVVVGEVGSERRVDYTVLGNTVNVAARLEEAVAKAGEVVIGPRTHELLAGELPAEPLGPYRLHGLGREVAAYRVGPPASGAPTVVLPTEPDGG